MGNAMIMGQSAGGIEQVFSKPPTLISCSPHYMEVWNNIIPGKQLFCSSQNICAALYSQLLSEKTSILFSINFMLNGSNADPDNGIICIVPYSTGGTKRATVKDTLNRSWEVYAYASPTPNQIYVWLTNQSSDTIAYMGNATITVLNYS